MAKLEALKTEVQEFQADGWLPSPSLKKIKVKSGTGESPLLLLLFFL